MKKRFLSCALALALALSLLPVPAHALGAFADVTDAGTARNVEVLRLMGVVAGDGDGRFRPYGRLTRAEFCKMAVELKGDGGEVVRYRSRTVFPDVRASHWACGYINLATAADEKTPGLMHGFPDGTFRPDKEISFGEAVTVLMRALGWTDADSGGIWPQGYLDLAAASGLTKGLSLTGAASITRAQAAQLFVNALSVKTKEGGTLRTLGSETTLLSIDLAKGVLRTADGKNPAMATPMMSTVLNGLKGRVLYNDKEEALTFLPSSGTASGGNYAGVVPSGDAAVIISADGSTAGFDALTGGSRSYTIYRNGNRVTPKSLRKNDVATYSAATNAVLVCDTRVTVCYEDFLPSREAPVMITALGGTLFPVLPAAQQSVARFRPGAVMTLLLTADGQIAGAVENGTADARANATGYVDSSGKVILFCGGSTIELSASGGDRIGEVVRISQTREGVYLTPEHSRIYGAVNVADGTYGDLKLAENVLVLEDGVLTSLESLGVSRIDAEQVIYARSNDAGDIDLIVLGIRESSYLYGRAKIYTSGAGEDAVYTITIDCGAQGKKGPYSFSAHGIQTGDFVFGELRNREDFVFSILKLDQISGVTKASWIGTETVTANGRTYTVSSLTPCWNADTEAWFESVEKAIEYGGTMNLYLKDDIVRVIEVRG